MAYTTIDNPELYFQTKIYAANNTDSTAITLDGDEDMSPNMCWWKNRSAAYSHRIIDTVRGVTKILTPDTNAAEATNSNALASFDSDGFTLNADGDGYGLNYDNTHNIVAWCWKAGSAFSNDASATSVGSIDSDGSINTTSGFAIIRWSGTAANATIAHGIAAPKMMIIKRISGGTESWIVYHQAISPAAHLFLNGTDAENADVDNFQDTATTSSVFSVGTYNQMNASGTDNMIAYCFAEKQGFSKFGGYTGNGDSGTDGTFVYLGFRPALLLVKRTNGTKDWKIFDNKRNGYNGSNEVLEPNNSDAEDTTEFLDFLSNGFKWRIPSSDAKYADVNGDGDTFVYYAVAEAPFVNSNGVPCNAR